MKITINEQKLRMLKLSGILNEDFKTQTTKFISQGFDKNIVDRYLASFREIKDKKYRQLFDDISGVNVTKDKRNNIDAYNTFHELETVVDYVRGRADVSGAS